MEIKHIKKKKNNIYEIILSDNTSLSFYDDTIIKYNLLSNKNINNNVLKEINLFNSRLEAYYKAIKYINRKLRTKTEIIKYLKEYDKDIINDVINRLVNEGYLNDELYISSYINDSVNLTLKGPLKIKNELLKLKFLENKIDKYLNEIDELLWIEKVKKIIDKKINSNHKLSNNMLINKIKYDLINLGYEKELINNELNNIVLDDDIELLKKEYLKIKKRLEKKYSGSELNYKIKQQLYQKGFSLEVIENLLNNN